MDCDNHCSYNHCGTACNPKFRRRIWLRRWRRKYRESQRPISVWAEPYQKVGWACKQENTKFSTEKTSHYAKRANGPSLLYAALDWIKHKWAILRAPLWACRVKFKRLIHHSQRLNRDLGKARRAICINNHITLNLGIRYARQNGRETHGISRQRNDNYSQPIKAKPKTAVRGFPRIHNHYPRTRVTPLLPARSLNKRYPNPNSLYSYTLLLWKISLIASGRA